MKEMALGRALRIKKMDIRWRERGFGKKKRKVKDVKAKKKKKKQKRKDGYSKALWVQM